MHYMHYKDYIHHGLAAEKTPPPLPQGGGTIWLGGGGGPCSYIYIYIHIVFPGHYIWKIFIYNYIYIWLIHHLLSEMFNKHQRSLASCEAPLLASTHRAAMNVFSAGTTFCVAIMKFLPNFPCVDG